MSVKWRGVFPAATTQFHSAGSLDLTGTTQHIDAMMWAGVHGVIALGTVGENCSLEYGEKLDVLRAVVKQVDGRIPVLTGVAEYTTALACRFAADARKAGVDGLMVLPAMVYKSDPRETLAHFRAVARATDLPILCYNNPVAYGVDITDDMLQLARQNAAKAGAVNVEFRKGQIEDLPLADGSVDVIISNCVINLSADKFKVLAEMFRVLVPGGRIGISDVVAEDHLSAEDRAAAGSYVGCIAGALSRTEYLDGLTAAGFAEASVTFTNQAAPGMHSAIVRAVKPAR